MTTSQATCPNCDQDRAPDSLDCPFCGIVYDRFDPERARRRTSAGEPAALAPQPVGQMPGELLGEAPQAQASRFDEVYRGAPVPAAGEWESGDEGSGAARPASVTAGPWGAAAARPEPRPGPTPESGFESWITGAPVVSLLVLFTLYFLLQGYWNARILGGTIRQQSVEGRLLTLSGLGPPEDYDDAGHVRFVGRDFVWFAKEVEPFPEMVVLYHRDAMAGVRSAEELVAELHGWLDEMGLPRHSFGARRGRLQGKEAQVEAFGLGPENNSVGEMALVTFEANDGHPALLVLVAPKRGFHALRRQYYR